MKILYVLLFFAIEVFSLGLHKFSLVASLSATYDDNIYNNTFEPTTNYGSIVLHNDTNTVGDTYINKLLYLKHDYQMPNYKDIGWYDTFVLYHRGGIKYSNQNILYGSIASGPKIRKFGYTIKSQIFLGDLTYAGEHYMYNYGIGIELLRKIFDNIFYTDSMFLVKKDRYIKDQNKLLNNKSFLCRLNIMHKLNKNNILKYLFSYGVTKKESGNITNISKDNYMLGIKYDRNFYFNYKIALGAQISRDDYTDVDPALGARNDRTVNYSIVVSKKFKKFYNLSLSYGYIKNNSSINFYSYKKNTITITFSKIFNYPHMKK